MSTDPGTTNDLPVGSTITLTYEDDWWVASDEATGVTSQGKTPHEALDNLDEALEGYHADGQPPSEEELQEVSGIGPATAASIREPLDKEVN